MVKPIGVSTLQGHQGAPLDDYVEENLEENVSDDDTQDNINNSR